MGCGTNIVPGFDAVNKQVKDRPLEMKIMAEFNASEASRGYYKQAVERIERKEIRDRQSGKVSPVNIDDVLMSDEIDQQALREYGAELPIGTEGIILGDDNVGVGENAGGLIEDGVGNVCVGRNTGDTITDGNYNMLLGSQSDVDVATDSYQTRIGHFGALRYLTAQITMDNFTAVSINDAATYSLLKIPRYGFLKRVTCTVVTASGGTGEYNISLGTDSVAPGAAISGRIELIGATATADSDFTGATFRQSTLSADGDSKVDIITADFVHIWEADQSTDDSSGWTLFEAQDRYFYICHASGSNGNNATNAVLRITAEYFGED